VSLAPNDLSLVDPHDPLSWDIAGFDPGTPRLMQMVALGEL
jgi:60 kDa SS-A/Ro ribonucleoprotein